MDREAVKSFVSRSRTALNDSPAMGVRNTQLRVIEPFLSLLGWDVRSGDVEAAYEARDGTVVDYALLAESTPGVFVTVEPAHESVSTADREQLVAAMRASNVPRGILTNGRTYVLVAVQENQTTGSSNGERNGSEVGGKESSGKMRGDPTSASVETVQFELEALSENPSALEALSFETVRELSAPKHRRAAKRLVESNEEAIATVTETVVELSGEDVAGDVEPLVRQFLEAVVDDLASKPDTADLDGVGNSELEGAAGDQADEKEERQTSAQASSQWGVDGETSNPDPAGGVGSNRSEAHPGEVDEGDGAPVKAEKQMEPEAEAEADTEYVVRFFEDGRSVAAVGNPSVDSAMAQAVEYLIRERGLGHRLQFPYAPGDDATAFLHRTPRHPDGSEMQAWRDLEDLALYTGQAVDEKQERVRTLAERVGLQVMFSGDWP